MVCKRASQKVNKHRPPISLANIKTVGIWSQWKELTWLISLDFWGWIPSIPTLYVFCNHSRCGHFLQQITNISCVNNVNGYKWSSVNNHSLFSYCLNLRQHWMYATYKQSSELQVSQSSCVHKITICHLPCWFLPSKVNGEAGTKPKVIGTWSPHLKTHGDLLNDDTLRLP